MVRRYGLNALLILFVVLMSVMALPYRFASVPAMSEKVSPHQSYNVALVRPAGAAQAPLVRAYRMVLKEEGFPFREVSPEELEDDSPSDIHDQFGAVVIPEEFNRDLSQALQEKLKEYVVREGGNVMASFDAGIGPQPGRTTPLGDLLGIQYDVDSRGLKRYRGPWFILPQSPIYKEFEQGVMTAGGRLKFHDYPVLEGPRLQLVNVTAQVLGYGRFYRVVLNPPSDDALFTEMSYQSGGTAFYVNGTPGVAKSRNNDDMLLRVPLKYFLISKARIPRLVSAPWGKGGLAIGVDICSAEYFDELDAIFKEKLFDPRLPKSFRITSGPDNLRPGDRGGFDAANPNRGLPYVRKLREYGSIGAQGGWIHDRWGFEFDKIPQAERKKYIELNFAELRQASGNPVIDYAAPGGQHDRSINDYLAAQGVRAASYPAAPNSPPTHVWSQGKLEERFWHFGYSGTRYGVAVENMMIEGASDSEIYSGLKNIVDTATRRREIRTFYTHPAGVVQKAKLWKLLESYIRRQKAGGLITVETVATYAQFLDRHQQVAFDFEKVDGRIRVAASSPSSLKSMTFAIPLSEGQKVAPITGLSVRQEESWAYVSVEGDVREVAFVVGE
ncbi:MAG: hypothetical protein M1598_07270 [Actinobacteria bacterium]|nr:hypothetical protein [Actinomycetota bacterium]